MERIRLDRDSKPVSLHVNWVWRRVSLDQALLLLTYTNAKISVDWPDFAISGGKCWD